MKEESIEKVKAMEDQQLREANDFFNDVANELNLQIGNLATEKAIQAAQNKKLQKQLESITHSYKELQLRFAEMEENFKDVDENKNE